MKLKNALEEKKLDIRLVDRFLSEGNLSKKDFDKSLKDLEDCEGLFEKVDEGSKEAKEEPATEL